jgi:Fe-S-cluster containining protein
LNYCELFRKVKESLIHSYIGPAEIRKPECDRLSFEHPVTVRFRCNRCTLCCGDAEKRVRNILLLKNEADRIAERTSKRVSEFTDRVSGFEPYLYRMKKNSGEKCLFLKNKSCAIYGIRPLICRFYPFELRSAGGDKYVFAYTNECPCIGTGPNLKREYFDRLFKRFVKMMKENLAEA